MNKKAQVQYIIGFLLLAVGVLAYFLFASPDFAPTIQAVTQFWYSIQWWVLGLVIFLFLWKIGLFKVLHIGK